MSWWLKAYIVPSREPGLVQFPAPIPSSSQQLITPFPGYLMPLALSTCTHMMRTDSCSHTHMHINIFKKTSASSLLLLAPAIFLLQMSQYKPHLFFSPQRASAGYAHFAGEVLWLCAEVLWHLPASSGEVQDGSGSHVRSLGIVRVIEACRRR